MRMTSAPQSKQLAGTSQPLLSKEKGQSHQSKSRDCEKGENQDVRKPHLGEKEKGQNKSMQ